MRKDIWREMKQEIEKEEAPYKNFKENDYQELFDRSMAILFDQVSKCDGLQLLAGMALYGFMGVIDSQGEAIVEIESVVNQSQLELIQGIVLSRQQGKDTPNAEVINKILDASSKAQIAYKRKNSNKYSSNIEMLLNTIRSHTQYRRDSGDIADRLQLVKRLTGSLNSLFENTLGVNGAEIIEIYNGIFDRVQLNSTKRYQGMIEVLQQNNSIDMIKKYYKINNYYDNASEKYSNKPIKYIKNALLTHSQSLIVNDYTFNTQSLSNQLGIAEEKIKKALKFISLDFGEIDPNKTSLFIDNPVWLRPLIKTDENKYFCCMPQLLIANMFRILQSIVDIHPQLKEEYKKKKSKFLENEIKSYFKSAFPGCEIRSRYEGNQSENDLLVKVSTYLLIIECKSGIVTMPALRGAHDRIKKHVKELIYHPSKQSSELEEKIKKVKQSPIVRDSVLPNFPFNLDEIDIVIRTSIIYEDFASIQTVSFLINDTDWIQNKHKLSPCITIRWTCSSPA